ncbi:chemotaxis protein CheW [Caldimonas thermodepolymerans]|jgi:twitching motility protein PilI|uniref:Chemotaxis protein CheW n=1 Tax=Caldimonas thermodepolymerans TaxID=215580 RepID=A0A2S5T3K1_9BURK|nr:chemotaxis protein CheW [Caldimonas thermodepolymerans]PPE69560.1 chemotaxis protein CheW [Caldimonas thermodepolymerans]QPC30927.1 chemotaxis protein CheW [Caldimonas thermodepolymerans]RDH97063.1 twitching motility protein PilI [Caldimonas thermodepolymerans]TCP09034.1 twitching motility protein PilI [Caldimonas thermodepolymerans]UZG43668.1 chemotaxis protein CheW [Caldimonas thermodepolymerans]
MAKKEALRELQSRLAERLQAARSEARTANWLAVESAGQGFLLPLSEAGEIFPFGAYVTVPHTKSWFLGVANLRGGLHGLVDLAGFLGFRNTASTVAPSDSLREQARLVAFNPALEVNCALLVERLAGLRSKEQLQAEADDGRVRPSFVGGRYRDGQGRRWQELSLSALAGDEAFLKIVG